MDYKRIYDNLISKGSLRTSLQGYSEMHHVIPRCMGGTDTRENLVRLTPEEHYLAHQLLTRIYPENRGIAFAALMMCRNRSTNKIYGWVRRHASNLQSIKTKGQGNPIFGKRWITDGTAVELVDKGAAIEKIAKGTHIAGKVAILAECGHLVKVRCIPCENKKRKSYDLKKVEAAILANRLFDQFKESSYNSVCEFAKANNTSQPRLSALWKRYVAEYRLDRQHGKKFK